MSDQQKQFEPVLEELWSDESGNFSWIDNSEETIVTGCDDSEALISAWTLILDGVIRLEVGISLKDFQPSVQIFCNQDCCLKFIVEEWQDISNIKTEHIIRLMLNGMEHQQNQKTFISNGIKIEAVNFTLDEKCIRISYGNNSVLLTKKAITRLFAAVTTVNQKLDNLNDHTMYWTYYNFICAVEQTLHREAKTDDESILSIGKFFCQNLKLLKSIVECRQWTTDFTFLLEIINIYSEKFVKDVRDKLRFK